MPSRADVAELADAPDLRSGAERRGGRGVRPGAGGVRGVWFLPVAWAANLALRSLGLTTVSLRTDEELAACAGLDIGCVVTFGAERADPVDPAFAPDAPRVVLA